MNLLHIQYQQQAYHVKKLIALLLNEKFELDQQFYKNLLLLILGLQ
jgi:hypothetical protein